MSGDAGRTVSFSLESRERRQAVEEYAIAKGFGSASCLARVALMQYIAKYPLKSAEKTQAVAKDEEGGKARQDAKTVQSTGEKPTVMEVKNE